MESQTQAQELAGLSSCADGSLRCPRFPGDVGGQWGGREESPLAWKGPPTGDGTTWALAQALAPPNLHYPVSARACCVHAAARPSVSSLRTWEGTRCMDVCVCSCMYMCVRVRDRIHPNSHSPPPGPGSLRPSMVCVQANGEAAWKGIATPTRHGPGLRAEAATGQRPRAGPQRGPGGPGRKMWPGGQPLESRPFRRAAGGTKAGRGELGSLGAGGDRPPSCWEDPAKGQCPICPHRRPHHVPVFCHTRLLRPKEPTIREAGAGEGPNLPLRPEPVSLLPPHTLSATFLLVRPKASSPLSERHYSRGTWRYPPAFRSWSGSDPGTPAGPNSGGPSGPACPGSAWREATSLFLAASSPSQPKGQWAAEAGPGLQCPNWSSRGPGREVSGC